MLAQIMQVTAIKPEERILDGSNLPAIWRLHYACNFSLTLFTPRHPTWGSKELPQSRQPIMQSCHRFVARIYLPFFIEDGVKGREHRFSTTVLGQLGYSWHDLAGVYCNMADYRGTPARTTFISTAGRHPTERSFRHSTSFED